MFPSCLCELLTFVPVWFWLFLVDPPSTPAPLLERLQLLLTRATGLGVLTVLLLSEWLLLLLPLLLLLLMV